MTSLSDQMTEKFTSMQALPWALEELPMPEIFPLFGNPDGTAATEAEATVDVHTHYASELTRVEQESYNHGYAEGETAARGECEARVALAVSALAEAAAMIQLHEARWVSNAEENIAALAVAVARHIVAREVTMDPIGIHALVTRALAQLPVDQPIVVRLHPMTWRHAER